VDEVKRERPRVVTRIPRPHHGWVRPAGITAGPEGNVWFTENGGDRIGKITTAGVVTEYNGGSLRAAVDVL
jgi:virginiamycin B lyase